MDLILNRLSDPDSSATPGDMVVGAETLYTLELPWADNHPQKSCVPLGLYELVEYDSPSHGNTWCLRNPALKIMGRDILSPDQVAAGLRSMCEIHAANWSRQLLGCIAIGLDHQPLLDPATGIVEPAVEHSRDAMGYLIAQLGPLSSGHTLLIQ